MAFASGVEDPPWRFAMATVAPRLGYGFHSPFGLRGTRRLVEDVSKVRGASERRFSGAHLERFTVLCALSFGRISIVEDAGDLEPEYKVRASPNPRAIVYLHIES